MAYPGYRPQYPPTPTGVRPPNPPNEAPLVPHPPRDSQPKWSEEGNDDHPIHRLSLSLINQSPAPFALYTPSALPLQPPSGVIDGIRHRSCQNDLDHRAGESGSGASPCLVALFIDFNMALCPTTNAINIDSLNKIRNTEVE